MEKLHRLLATNSKLLKQEISPRPLSHIALTKPTLRVEPTKTTKVTLNLLAAPKSSLAVKTKNGSDMYASHSTPSDMKGPRAFTSQSSKSKLLNLAVSQRVAGLLELRSGA